MSAEDQQQITGLRQSLYHPILLPAEMQRAMEWQERNPLNSILGALASLSRDGLSPRKKEFFDKNVTACTTQILSQQYDAREQLRQTFDEFSTRGQQPTEEDLLESIKKSLGGPNMGVPELIQDHSVMRITAADSNLTFRNFCAPILTTLLETLDVDPTMLYSNLSWEAISHDPGNRVDRLEKPVLTNIQGVQFHSERRVTPDGISYQFFLALNKEAATDFVKSPAVRM